MVKWYIKLLSVLFYMLNDKVTGERYACSRQMGVKDKLPGF